MFIETGTLTLMQTLIAALLAAFSTRPAAALLTTPTISLWSSFTGSITPQSTYSQFTLCTFSGYAADAITLSGPVNLGGTVWGMISTADFIATTASPFVPDTAAGYILSDGVSNLYAAEQFATPVPFPSPTSFLGINFALPLNAIQRS